MEITGVKIIAGTLFFLAQGEWIHEDLVTSPEWKDAVSVFFRKFSRTVKLAEAFAPPLGREIEKQ